MTKSAGAFAAIAGSHPPTCPRLVALIPVHKTEAWLLADKDLLRTVMNTALPLPDLAARIGTIAYELLTNVSERVRRVFYSE